MELIIKDLIKTFDGKMILDQASFTFEKGKIYGLLGRNGAGKTTLFNCMSKDISIDSGELVLQVDGKLEDYADTKVGLVQAVPNIPDFMTGYEFIKFFIDMNGNSMTHVESPEYYLEKIGIKNKIITVY